MKICQLFGLGVFFGVYIDLYAVHILYNILAATVLLKDVTNSYKAVSNPFTVDRKFSQQIQILMENVTLFPMT